MIWAAFYRIFDLLPNMKDAMLYSMQSYTTLGSSIAIQGSWAGFGDFEATTGMLIRLVNGHPCCGSAEVLFDRRLTRPRLSQP
jgi:hypothetical protein